MKKYHLLAIAGIILIFLFGTLIAGDSKKDKHPSLPSALKYQTLCPVDDKPIDTRIYFDIQGCRVYFCSKECMEVFKADPEKYFKKAGEQNIVFESLLETCPFSGEKLDKSVFTYYQGRLLYLCNKEARDLFVNDRAKYLKMLDDFMKSEATKKAEK